MQSLVNLSKLSEIILKSLIKKIPQMSMLIITEEFHMNELKNFQKQFLIFQKLFDSILKMETLTSIEDVVMILSENLILPSLITVLLLN